MGVGLDETLERLMLSGLKASGGRLPGAPCIPALHAKPAPLHWFWRARLASTPNPAAWTLNVTPSTPLPQP